MKTVCGVAWYMCPLSSTTTLCVGSTRTTVPVTTCCAATDVTASKTSAHAASPTRRQGCEGEGEGKGQGHGQGGHGKSLESGADPAGQGRNASPRFRARARR